MAIGLYSTTLEVYKMHTMYMYIFQVLIDEYTDDVIELLINEILDPQTGTHFYVFGTNYIVQYDLFASIKFVRSWDFARHQPFHLNP